MSWSNKPLQHSWEVYDDRMREGKPGQRYLRNIAWVEQNCFVPSGKDVGKPIRLRPVQRLLFRMIYSDLVPARTVIFSVGRKNMKTATSALINVLNLAGPEAQQNSDMYSTAQNRDQAAIVFNLAAKVIRLSPNLEPFIIIRDTVKELVNPRLGCTFKALSADAKSQLGLSPRVAIHDELGAVSGPIHPLYEAVETATAAHESPLSIIISTQAPDDGDLLSILIDDGLKGEDPSTKVLLFTAPVDADPFDIETVRKANPGLGDVMNQEEVMRMAEKARRMPSREASYRNLVLNQRIDVYNPFVSKQIWSANGDMPEPRGPCYGGLDLSEVNDLTALELVFPQETGWDVESHFWLPSKDLRDRSQNDRVPYDVWADEGYLTTTPGASIEYEFVARRISELMQKYDIRGIAFDRYNMRHLRPWLIKEGISEALVDERFIEFGQGFVSMSPALNVFESLLLNARLRHGNNPVLSMCAKNAVVKYNEAGDRKLDKARSRGRIDGMVSLAMACALANERIGTSKVFAESSLEEIFV